MKNGHLQGIENIPLEDNRATTMQSKLENINSNKIRRIKINYKGRSCNASGFKKVFKLIIVVHRKIQNLQSHSCIHDPQALIVAKYMDRSHLGRNSNGHAQVLNPSVGIDDDQVA